MNDCPLSSPCHIVGTCEDALRSNWCSGNAGFETVMKDHPNNFMCTPQVCGEPRLVRRLSTHVTQGIMSISKQKQIRFKAKCSEEGEEQRQARA